MSGSDGIGGRVVPLYCPYCGDEDLRPYEGEGAGMRDWHCRSCLRVFTVTFLGTGVPT
jgi:transposase-like protein